MATLDRALRQRQLSLELSTLSGEPQSSRVTFSALRRLGNSRRLRLHGLRLLKRFKLDPKALHPKFRLWSAVAGDLTAA